MGREGRFWEAGKPGRLFHPDRAGGGGAPENQEGDPAAVVPDTEIPPNSMKQARSAYAKATADSIRRSFNAEGLQASPCILPAWLAVL